MWNSDLGLLILRLAAGGIMFYAHGLVKVANYAQFAAQFPDPIGLGAKTSLILVIFAELVCSLFILLGLFSRLALLPAMFNMCVAYFVVLSAAPFDKKELALIFLCMYAVLFLTGPGRYSVQNMFKISAGRLPWLLK